MRHLYAIVLFYALWAIGAAQAQNVGIGTAAPAARFEVDGSMAVRPTTQAAAAAITIPSHESVVRVTNDAVNVAITVNAPATATEGQMLTIRNEDAANPATFVGYAIPVGQVADFVYLGGAWRLRSVSSVGSVAWGITGNANISASTNFLGTTTNVPLRLRVFNIWAGSVGSNGVTSIGMEAGMNSTTTLTAIGDQAARNTTTGFGNSAVGYRALYTNTTGQFNTAIGYEALAANTTSWSNTAVGYQALDVNTTGSFNSAFGDAALTANTIGEANCAFGMQTLQLNVSGSYNCAFGTMALASNTTAGGNTAIGYNSLVLNTTGSLNTAVGSTTLSTNTTGYQNVAVGNNALWRNTTGIRNSAVGAGALQNNTNGSNNTAVGLFALLTNTTGSLNTAVGSGTLADNTTGSYNAAFGFSALGNNTLGNYNTAIGIYALDANTTGFENTAIGTGALSSNIAGTQNVAVGRSAMSSSSNTSANVAIGNNALLYNIFGTHNVAIGHYCLGNNIIGTAHQFSTFIGASIDITTDRTNVTGIGYSITNGQCTGNNQVLLGNTAITQIRAQVTGITAYSDARYKTNVQANVPGLAFVRQLQPVTYNVRPTELHRIWGTPDSAVARIDHSEIEATRQIGFIAQDVERAAAAAGFTFPGIDVPRNDNEAYTLRYTDFVMPLVQSVRELADENDALRAALAQQQAQLEALRQAVERLSANTAGQ